METNNECITPLKVMKSAAGYYLGHACYVEEDGGFKYEVPYSRESGYFRTKEEAQQALELFIGNDANE